MEPMTTPDCDLRDFPFMPLDVARLLDSDLFALSNGDEFKAAIALWCKCWTQVPAGSLPDDDRVLAHLSGAGTRWKRVRAMALRGFIKCSDGRLYHSTVSEKAAEAWAKKQSFRERSKKGNAKRWGADKDSQTNPTSNPKAIAKGLLERPKREGEGEGYITLSSNEDNDASVVLPLPLPVAASDPDRAFWDSAKSYLGPKRASMIGKWARDYGRDVTAKAITEAQVNRAVDPIPYIEKCLRRAASSGDDCEFSGPC